MSRSMNGWRQTSFSSSAPGTSRPMGSASTSQALKVASAISLAMMIRSPFTRKAW